MSTYTSIPTTSGPPVPPAATRRLLLAPALFILALVLTAFVTHHATLSSSTRALVPVAAAAAAARALKVASVAGARHSANPRVSRPALARRLRRAAKALSAPRTLRSPESAYFDKPLPKALCEKYIDFCYTDYDAVYYYSYYVKPEGVMPGFEGMSTCFACCYDQEQNLSSKTLDQCHENMNYWALFA